MPRELIDAEQDEAAAVLDQAGTEDTLDTLLQEKYEPIAIVGVGLKFPGGSESLDEFSKFLAEGRSGISPLPTDRWDVEAFTPEGDERGKIRTSGGGFLDRIDLFDPSFFNISPKEAQYIDPQQRMLLETAWQALENANIDPTPLRRGNGGVYVGASSIDYALELDSLPYADLDGLLASGITMFPLSGRISYFLGWRGPSASIDTACSSSLTALHMAVQGLRRGETDIALCGGVNALHHPRIPVIFSHGQMLAPDGQCKTFDDSADGYVRAEGCGVIVLKRLSTAERDGDNILAVIRGTSVGQDGDSAGLTVPNGAAQEIVIRKALAAARLTPADISYVEAHGTGTPLGDPIELGAINDVFSDSHTKDNPLVVGSAKTNLGHMEPASGLVGLIKVVAQLQSSTIYPHLNYHTPSGRIPWDLYPIEIPTEPRPWAAPVKRAVVNSFGFAGTIAAVVLEQAPERTSGTDTAIERPAVLTVSAKSAAALADQLRSYQQLLTDQPDLDIHRLSATSNLGRAHFKHRVAAVATDRAGLVKALDRELERTDRPEPAGIRKTAFLFTGQGSQYAGMGAKLYAQHPVFARWVDECDRLFTPLLEQSVRALILGTAADPDEIHQTGYTQPALFTLEYALAQLWMSWGIQPSVLVGHSIGEVVAAAVAGVFDLPDAVTLVAARGRLMQSVTEPGGMAAISTPAENLTELLAGYDDLALAAVNAPDQCVISGGVASLAAATATLQADGIRVDQLSVSHAFHSPLMTEVYDEFRTALAGITFHEPTIGVVSNVSGRTARRGELTDPEYWVRHIGSPVLFMAGIRAAVRRGRHALIEIGPSTALTALAGRCLDSEDHLWLASLRRRDTGGETIANALAQAYPGGLNLNWAGVHAGVRPEPLTLPSYRFQRKRYWLPNGSGAAVRPGSTGSAVHPLLGELSSEQTVDGVTTREFTADISAEYPAHLADHVIDGSVVLPVSAYVETIMAAQDAVWGHTGRVITDLELTQPLVLTEAAVQLRTTLISRDTADRTVEVQIDSISKGEVVPHGTATLGMDPVPLTPGDDLWQDLYTGRPITTAVPVADLYTDLGSVGRDYGPGYQRLTAVDCHPGGVVTATLTNRPATALEQLPVEVLESALLALAGADLDGVTRTPIAVQSIRMFKKPRGGQLQVRAETRPGPNERWTADLLVLEGQNPVAEFRGVVLARSEGTARRHFEHELVWVPSELDEPATTREQHVLLVNGTPPTERAGTTVSTAGSAEAAAALQDTTITDVCWFWQHTGVVTAEGIRAECEANYRDLLSLLGALDAVPSSRKLRLWLVTRGAQLLPGDTPDDGLALASNTLWGFARALSKEYPRYCATIVDLDSPANDGLFDEIGGDSTDELQLAHRGGSRYVRRLRPAEPASPSTDSISDAVRLRPDRTYLITGGLGGLGLVTAGKLVDLGARKLALVSRSGVPTPEAAELLDELRTRADVRLLSADVGSESDVVALFEQLQGTDHPVGGIVHAAGAIGNCLIRGLDWEQIDAQLRPKVYGAWSLHQASRSLTDLDFFVIYTSIAGVTGGISQAHYAAASTFGDGLATWRRAHGLPGLATDWGSWAGVGMSARLAEPLRRQVEETGIRFFSPTRALRSLAGLLTGPAGHRVLGEYDLDVIAAGSPLPDAVYADVAQPIKPVEAALDVLALLDQPKEQRLATIAGLVRATVASALQFDDPDSIDANAELLSLGLDSLMAMEVKRGVEAAFGLSLAASLAYDYPTVRRLTEFVAEQLPAAAS